MNPMDETVVVLPPQIYTTPPPPRRPSPWWAVAILLTILAIVLALVLWRNTTNSSTVSATPTSAIVPSVTMTAMLVTATPTPPAAVTATVAPQLPTNPTALHVSSGSCTNHRIAWTWVGANSATSYDVVVYDPRTGATITTANTTTAAYTMPADMGTIAALKVRSHNAGGTAPDYFTPGSIGSVPPATTNPTSMLVSVGQGHRITWSWTGALHATAYDVVMYHYNGATPRTDIVSRTDQGQWSTTVTPGIGYFLKVRSVGRCTSSAYFTPPHGATAGATPTPGA